MASYEGSVCPYCKEEIGSGDAVVVCPECGIAHHSACWRDHEGCSTFGCPQQGVLRAQKEETKKEDRPRGVCAGCGRPLPANAAFCPGCGKPAAGAPSPSPAKNETDYYANKLLLCTVMGLVALFTSVLGFIPCIISLQMANELPLEFSPVDVRRARSISTAACIINLIEVIAGIIVGIVVMIDYFS